MLTRLKCLQDIEDNSHWFIVTEIKHSCFGFSQHANAGKTQVQKTINSIIHCVIQRQYADLSMRMQTSQSQTTQIKVVSTVGIISCATTRCLVITQLYSQWCSYCEYVTVTDSLGWGHKIRSEPQLKTTNKHWGDEENTSTSPNPKFYRHRKDTWASALFGRLLTRDSFG